MTFPTPPRGSGRHWRNDDAPTTWTRRRFAPAAAAPADERYHMPDDFPTDPTMPAPLNEPAPRPVGQYARRPTVAAPEPRRLDVVVPRVFVEPDEQMDRLRARALRWAIARDVVAVAVGLWLLGSWILPPLLRAFGF